MEVSFANVVLLPVFVKIIFSMALLWLAVIMRAISYIFPVFFFIGKGHFSG